MGILYIEYTDERSSEFVARIQCFPGAKILATPIWAPIKLQSVETTGVGGADV